MTSLDHPPAATPKADRALIRRLSLDILLRSPTPAEARTYRGYPVDKLARRMMGTLETMQVWLEEELLFFLLLDNFRPKTRAVKTIPKRLQRGLITPVDAIHEIMISTGFQLRNPGNDTFVTVVLEQGLGMRVQDRKNVRVLEAGKKLYDGYKTKFLGQYGKNQSDVVKIVLQQKLFIRHLLNRYHLKIMRGPLPQTAAGNATVDRVHQDHRQLFPVLCEWFSSEQYHAQLRTKRPRTNHQFVRSLYMDLLERQPDYQEFRNMRNALLSMADPSPLRAVMAKVILDSGRAKLPEMARGDEEDFIRGCFLRYLGRHPTQLEQTKFTNIVKDPDITGEVVVRALVTSPEYQYY